MFTGLIETTVRHKKTRKVQNGHQLIFSGHTSGDILKRGQSIAVNGVCLTLEQDCQKNSDMFFFVMPDTFKDTNLSRLKKGDIVNIERAMPADGRFEGHIVLGHVHSELKVHRIQKDNTGHSLHFRLPRRFREAVIEKGSIAINGVSLTVQEKKHDYFRVSIIRETADNTNLSFLNTGDNVNIEFDHMRSSFTDKSSGLTIAHLKRMGY